MVESVRLGSLSSLDLSRQRLAGCVLQRSRDLMALGAEWNHWPAVSTDDVRDDMMRLKRTPKPAELLLGHAADITSRFGACY